MSDQVDNTSELEKSMAEAMEELEYEIASEFQDQEPGDVQKAIDFDLQQVVVEDDNFDTHAFLKSMGEVSQSNLGRLARAMESLLKVTSAQSDLIKGLSDKIKDLSKTPVVTTPKVALTPDMAKAMITERPFGNLIEGTSTSSESTDNGPLVGPYKERLRKALLKGIEADTIDNESALTVLGMQDDTAISYIMKVVKPEVKALIESVTKVQ